MHAPEEEPKAVASVIDHTLLKPDASCADIVRVCHEAIDLGFATVCVNPVWVATCADVFRNRGGTTEEGQEGTMRFATGAKPPPGICTVVGFPLGAATSDVKAYETRRAIADGATEIDMVMNIGALKSGDMAVVERDIASVTAACRENGVVSKVIIEAALLSDEEKVTACTIAQAAGAGYVKSSTGFGPGGATTADVALMRRVVGQTMGVKAAGGIRDLATLRAMLQAGATRIGTSAGVRIVREIRGAAPATEPGY